MSHTVILAIASLAVTCLLATLGFVFGVGRWKGQVDTNKQGIEKNAEAGRLLAQRINGNLERIDQRLQNGNRELGMLTEAVETLKEQTTDCSNKIAVIQVDLAAVKAKMEG